MKNLIFCFLLLSISLPKNAAAQGNEANTLIRFLAGVPMLKEYALYSLMSNRCTRYLQANHAAPCKEAVKRQMEILDFDLVFLDKEFKALNGETPPDPFVFVAFKKGLIAHLSQAKTSSYLDALKEAMNLYMAGENQDFNFWDFTLTHYKTDKAAAEVIASLFQDTSRLKLHLGYLELKGPQVGHNFNLNKEKLSSVIDTINLLLDYTQENIQLFYPKGIQEDLARNIYHFYVPLHLSLALEGSRIQKQYARMAPLMMSLTYEFITSADDYRYVYLDPIRLDPVANEGTLRDLYGCYSGVNFGMGKPVLNSKFQVLSDKFSRSTEDGVRFLLNF